MTGIGASEGSLLPRADGHRSGCSLVQVSEEIALSVLSESCQAARFPLHGAWAVGAWIGGQPRPTRGIDLLDLERGSAEAIVTSLADALGSRPGGMVLEWSGVRVRAKAARRSPLHRVCIPARIGHHRLDLRIDVMAAQHPAPEVEFRPLHVNGAKKSPLWAACCTAEEIVAEKAALLVTYGSDHTRLQDILDLWLLSERVRLDGPALADAMAATFAGRDAARMLERDDGYWEAAFVPSRITHADRVRWDTLLAGAGSPLRIPDLATTLLDVARFLVPVLRSLRYGMGVPAGWLPGISWCVGGVWQPRPPCSSAGALPESPKAATVMMGVGRK